MTAPPDPDPAVTELSFALTLDRAVTEAEIEALYEACDGQLEVETGPLGTVVEIYTAPLMAGPRLVAAAGAAVHAVAAAVPAGWVVKTEGYPPAREAAYVEAHGGDDLETGHLRDPRGDEAAHG